MVVGKISEFSVKDGNWGVYCERLNMYIIANGIPDNLKLATLIAVMGEEAYLLLSTLTSPKEPTSLTYEEAVSMMKTHLQPKLSILAERYTFRQRRQIDGETITDYVAQLKILAKSCEFGLTLEENLRDQFVCGLLRELTRKRLFVEDNLTFDGAVKLAVSVEAAEKNANAVDEGNKEAVNTNNSNSVKCASCGNIEHITEKCKYRNVECSCCHMLGHLRRLCPKRAVAAEAAAILSEKTNFDRKPSVSAKSGGSSSGVGGIAGRGKRFSYSGPSGVSNGGFSGVSNGWQRGYGRGSYGERGGAHGRAGLFPWRSLSAGNFFAGKLTTQLLTRPLPEKKDEKSDSQKSLTKTK